MAGMKKDTRRGVAQPGSAPALGAGSRRFKSSRPDHDIRGCRVKGVEMVCDGLFNPCTLTPMSRSVAPVAQPGQSNGLRSRVSPVQIGPGAPIMA